MLNTWWLKPALGLLVCIAIGFFWHSYTARGDRIDDLELWQTNVTLAVTNAMVEPDEDGKREMLEPHEVQNVLQLLARNYDECQRTLDGITTGAHKAKAQSDQEDERLREEMRRLQERYRAASNRIERLENRPPVEGSCEEKLEAIENDSRSAWEGWSQ